MNERLKRSLIAGHHPLLADHLSDENVRQEAVQSLTGGIPAPPPSANLKIRANVQEVVGEAWAKYMLYGNDNASVVDWISEAITVRLAENPGYFHE